MFILFTVCVFATFISVCVCVCVRVCVAGWLVVLDLTTL